MHSDNNRWRHQCKTQNKDKKHRWPIAIVIFSKLEMTMLAVVYQSYKAFE